MKPIWIVDDDPSIRFVLEKALARENLPKPFDLPKAVELIRRAVEESQREEVTEERQAEAPEMLGQAPAMQDVFRAIGRLSQSQVTVLITGESGSGKELD